MENNFQQKLQHLISLCEGKANPVGGELFMATVEFLRILQNHQVGVDERERLIKAVCSSFSLSKDELIKHTFSLGSQIPNGNSNENRGTIRFKLSGYNPLSIEEELDALIPQSGYFRHYVDYTRNSEAPLAYHFFSSLIGVAAVINRRVHLRWGLFNYYPATGVILIGPSGLRKTSASDVMVKMLQSLQLIKVYAEKITPEDLINTMKGDNATGLVYAPEMAVMLNRKKYNEGLIELLTRWMDCPDVWESSTLSRGRTILTNVGVSSIMCSTPDWLMDNLPEGTFGGGFIARLLLVVQETSPREVVKPEPLDPTDAERLKYELAYLHQFQGEMTLSDEAMQSQVEWYHSHKQSSEHPEHELMGTYYQRKQGHVLRLAMCLHLATHYDTDSPFIICKSCHDMAVKILDWNEKFLPNLFSQLFKTSIGQEQEQVLRVIKSNSGAISHVQLLRKLQHKYDAQKIKSLITSLKEAGQVREENSLLGHLYIMEEK